MNFAELRNKYPQYNDMSDEDLAKSFHKKYYSDLSFDDFAGKIGYKPMSNEELMARIKNSAPENRRKLSAGLLGALTALDSGRTFGFGRKIGGFFGGLESLGAGEGFSKGYHEIVDPAVQAEQELYEAHPVAGTALNVYGAIKNPVNVAAANYVVKAPSLAAKVGRLGAVGGGTGAVNAIGQSESPEELAERLQTEPLFGAAINVAMPGVGKVAQNAWEGTKKLFPSLSVVAKKTGLANVVKDNDSLRTLKRGIQNSDEIAFQVAEEVPAALNRVNAEAQEILEKTAGRRLDIDKALQNQRARYGAFIDKNADMRLLDLSPETTRYRGGEEQSVLKSIRRNMEKTDSDFSLAKTPEGNIDYPHFLKDRQRAQYIGTLPNTYKNPDAVVSGTNNGQNREYLFKQYYNPENGKNVFDIGIKSDDGVLINKIAREGKKGKDYVDNLLGLQRTSGGGQASRTGQMERASVPAEQHNINVTSPALNVNPKPLHISKLREGLSQRQIEYLNKAISEGEARSLQKPGSLDALHKALESLNTMIDKSYLAEGIGLKKTTAETRDMLQVKEKINNVLRSSGVKTYDEGISKAKSLRSFYEMGYKFKPSETKFNNLGLKNVRDRKAFLQGRIAKILDNVQDGKSLAAVIKKDENTLKHLIAPEKYKRLMKDLTQLETEHDRLSDLASRANKQLVKPEALERPLSEKWESLGSVIGSLADKLSGSAYSRANMKASQMLLNGIPERTIRGRSLAEAAKLLRNRFGSDIDIIASNPAAAYIAYLNSQER